MLKRAERHADRASRIGFLLAVLFCVGAGAYGLTLAPRTPNGIGQAAALANETALRAGFRIETLTASGVKYTPHDALMSALNLRSETSILFFDTAAAREALLRVGWVETADVRRVLPSGLQVTLKERIPFARFIADGKTAIVDRDGRILGDDETGKYAALPLFEGEGAPAGAAPLQEALKSHDALAANIDRAELVAGRFWTLKLKNGLAVKLPHKVEELQLLRLETILANAKVADMALDTIDLRLPNRTVLQLHNADVTDRNKAIVVLTGGARTLTANAPPKGKAF